MKKKWVFLFWTKPSTDFDQWLVEMVRKCPKITVLLESQCSSMDCSMLWTRPFLQWWHRSSCNSSVPFLDREKAEEIGDHIDCCFVSGVSFNDVVHLTVNDSTEGFLRDRRVLLKSKGKWSLAGLHRWHCFLEAVKSLVITRWPRKLSSCGCIRGTVCRS